MAGIGITLRKLVAGQNYLQGAGAYFSSAVITAGPWLISALALALLQGAITASLALADRLLLFATITYVFVGSSILTGAVQVVLTRIVADHIFLQELESIAPSLSRTLAGSTAVLSLIALPFGLLAPFTLPYRFLATSLFLAVSLIWLVLAVLSAAQDYLSIVMAFVIGYAVSGIATLGLVRPYGVAGALAGFALGQVVCLGILLRRAYSEFPEQAGVTIELGPYWKKYWSLALIGSLYYLGLWAEKFVYWLSPAATTVGGFYRTFPPYDSAILLAYLLTVPASAVFMVNLETDFYQHYHAFFNYVLGRKGPAARRSAEGTFDQITQAKAGMIHSARVGALTLLKVQGMVAGFALLLAPDLARLLGLADRYLLTLRIAVLAASGQMFVLYAMLLLLYVDARRQALVLTLVFALSNLGLTLAAERVAPGGYGLGYLSATVITALLGLRLLNTALARLDFVTFMLQPLESPDQPSTSRKHSSAMTRVPEPPPQ